MAVDPWQFSGAEFTSWLVVALFFVVVGCLLSRTEDRTTALAQRWERVSSWLAAHSRSESHADDEEELFAWSEARRVAREERLHADLARLRHLIATDTYMSATRQIGNRIAYRQLLVEVGSLGAQPRTLPPDRRWAIERTDLQTTRQISGPETLDIRWR